MDLKNFRTCSECHQTRNFEGVSGNTCRECLGQVQHLPPTRLDHLGYAVLQLQGIDSRLQKLSELVFEHPEVFGVKASTFAASLVQRRFDEPRRDFAQLRSALHELISEAIYQKGLEESYLEQRESLAKEIVEYESDTFSAKGWEMTHEKAVVIADRLIKQWTSAGMERLDGIRIADECSESGLFEKEG